MQSIINMVIVNQNQHIGHGNQLAFSYQPILKYKHDVEFNQ